ncbi:hypothetical protein Tco_0904318 [Tanacetum coccineum]
MLFTMPSWKQVNPPYKFNWTEKTVLVAEGSSETTIEGYIENYKNVSQDIRDQLNAEAEAEAVQIILTGIDNDIYSIIDACPNACEIINADLEKFHLCLKEEMVADLRYFNSLEHEVDSLKSQLETQKTQFLNEIDRLSREYYYADHMNAILGVYTDLNKVTNLQCDYLETWENCEHLEKELSNRKTMSKSFEALQKHAINLELYLQHCKEKIKMTNLSKKISQTYF